MRQNFTYRLLETIYCQSAADRPLSSSIRVYLVESRLCSVDADRMGVGAKCSHCEGRKATAIVNEYHIRTFRTTNSVVLFFARWALYRSSDKYRDIQGVAEKGTCMRRCDSSCHFSCIGMCLLIRFETHVTRHEFTLTLPLQSP